ncbi:hypothetical protein HK098_007504 [Nowakowskiella sp. JEL0407]|nr:hypothetical protein HK098_007504 [Nowakowskiella sp. JEL0407]
MSFPFPPPNPANMLNPSFPPFGQFPPNFQSPIPPPINPNVSMPPMQNFPTALPGMFMRPQMPFALPPYLPQYPSPAPPSQPAPSKDPQYPVPAANLFNPSFQPFGPPPQPFNFPGPFFGPIPMPGMPMPPRMIPMGPFPPPPPAQNGIGRPPMPFYPPYSGMFPFQPSGTSLAPFHHRSDTPVMPSTSAKKGSSGFAVDLMVIVAARVLNSIGFARAHVSSVAVIAELIPLYIEMIARRAKANAEACGRTGINLHDVGYIFDDLGVDVDLLMDFGSTVMKKAAKEIEERAREDKGKEVDNGAREVESEENSMFPRLEPGSFPINIAEIKNEKKDRPPNEKPSEEPYLPPKPPSKPQRVPDVTLPISRMDIGPSGILPPFPPIPLMLPPLPMSSNAASAFSNPINNRLALGATNSNEKPTPKKSKVDPFKTVVKFKNSKLSELVDKSDLVVEVPSRAVDDKDSDSKEPDHQYPNNRHDSISNLLEAALDAISLDSTPRATLIPNNNALLLLQHRLANVVPGPSTLDLDTLFQSDPRPSLITAQSSHVIPHLLSFFGVEGAQLEYEIYLERMERRNREKLEKSGKQSGGGSVTIREAKDDAIDMIRPIGDGPFALTAGLSSGVRVQPKVTLKLSLLSTPQQPQENSTEKQDQIPDVSDFFQKAAVDTVHCICAPPECYNNSAFMVACDKCGVWFHGKCVDYKETSAEWYCVRCGPGISSSSRNGGAAATGAAGFVEQVAEQGFEKDTYVEEFVEEIVGEHDTLKEQRVEEEMVLDLTDEIEEAYEEEMGEVEREQEMIDLTEGNDGEEVDEDMDDVIDSLLDF